MMGSSMRTRVRAVFENGDGVEGKRWRPQADSGHLIEIPALLPTVHFDLQISHLIAIFQLIVIGFCYSVFYQS